MLRLFASALVALVLVTGAALAAGGGPSPGLSAGWDGAVDPSRTVRYVALSGGTTTTIAAVRTSDGRMLRYSTIHGVFGIPLVAFDGTTEGVSHDGTHARPRRVRRPARSRLISPSCARLGSGCEDGS